MEPNPIIGLFVPATAPPLIKDPNLSKSLLAIQTWANAIMTAFKNQDLLEFTDSSGDIVVRIGWTADNHYGLWIYDTSGTLRAAAGAQTDGTIGFWYYDTAGTHRGTLGEQSDGTYGVWYYDNSGDVILKSGGYGDGSYGDWVYDTVGRIRVKYGFQNGGTYSSEYLDTGAVIRLREGLQTDGTYATWVFDGTGQVRMIEGLHANGTYASWVFDATGQVRVKEGLQTDGTYATWYYDASGTLMAKTGDLGDGIFGVAMATDTSAMQWLAWRNLGNATGPATYSTNAWGSISGPTVAVRIGASGAAQIAIGANIQPGSYSAGETAQMRPAVDGTGISQPTVSVSVDPLSSNSYVAYAEAYVSGMSDAVHTFTLQGWVSTGGVTATYTNMSLAVTPQ